MNGDTALAQLLALALQQRDAAHEQIAQLQGELRETKAQLAAEAEKPKPARNGRKAVTDATETVG